MQRLPIIRDGGILTTKMVFNIMFSKVQETSQQGKQKKRNRITGEWGDNYINMFSVHDVAIPHKMYTREDPQ